MKKTKTQNGITLIALIITIVVLLILAGVTIDSVQDGGIITKAEQAADKYTQAQEDELAMLDEYVGEIMLSNPQIGKVQNQEGTDLVFGECIEYNGDIYVVMYNDDENGLQIVATTIDEDVTLTLSGFSDWENRYDIFKQACARYVKKSLGAIDGRVFGTTFNEMKIDLRDRAGVDMQFDLMVNESGVERQIKLLGYAGLGSIGDDVDLQSNKSAFSALKSILGSGAKFWTSLTYMSSKTLSEFSCYSVNFSNSDYYVGNTLAEMNSASNSQETALVYTETNSYEVTSNILPIILLDQRITITGGNGSYESPYEYTFNG